MTYQSNKIALDSSFGSTDTESDKPVRPPSPVSSDIISPTHSMESLSFKYSESTSPNSGLVTQKSDTLAKTCMNEEYENNNKIVDMTKVNGGNMNPYLDLSKEHISKIFKGGTHKVRPDECERERAFSANIQ
eukprot:scaffold320580_cov182-Cyclotella_meneghiniana.AAC.1